MRLIPPMSFPTTKKQAMTETHGAMSIIARISPFQVHRIYLGIFLQYFPCPWVFAPRSDIYRSRSSLPARKFLPTFFSMTICSNWLKKAELGSVLTSFYNVFPIIGSFLPVLGSPDTEMAPKTAPRGQNPTNPLLHQ